MECEKILFIYPPAGKQKNWEYSLGLNYIEGYLKKNNINAKQYIPNKGLTIKEIADCIIELNPDILGFSCYDSNYYYIRLLIEEIKANSPDILIIVGGPTATFSWNLIMEDCGGIDICSIGEGEITTLEIIKEYYNGRNWDRIKGIVYRKKGKIVENAHRPLVEDIDEFPSPYLSNINVEYNERIVVLTSRGCVYNCVYCNCTTICSKKIRYHSIKRVVDELEFISKRIQNENQLVQIGDDAFTLNVERAKKICREIIRRKIKMKLFCETRADKIDNELLQLLKEAGFVKIDFGLESANPKVLRAIKKVFYDPKDAEFQSEKNFIFNMKRVVEKCKRIGLSPMVNVISGLPTENLEEARETIKFVHELEIRNYSHNLLRIYAGTELFEKYKEYGYDIYNPPFVLPYIVKYPLNVMEVGELNNSINRHEIGTLKKVVNCLLSGYGYEYNHPIIFSGSKKMESSYLREMIRKFRINEEIFIEEKLSLMEMLVDYRVPSNKFYSISKIDNEIRVTSFGEKNIHLILQKIDIENEQFIKPNSFKKMYLVDISSINQIDKILKKKTLNPFINPTIIVKNQCKFCLKECPLWKGIRGEIKVDKMVFMPCFSETSVKNIENNEWLINNVTEIYSNRGCINCVVKDKCPKCLYTWPLTESDYCKIMKKYHFDFDDYDLIDEFCKVHQYGDDCKQQLYTLKKEFNKRFSDIGVEDLKKNFRYIDKTTLEFFSFYKNKY